MSDTPWNVTQGPFYPAAGRPLLPFLKRWFLRLGLAAGLLGGLVVFHKPALVGFAQAFRVNDPEPSDAIVILLGGASHRPKLAADLFHRKIAPRIVFCQIVGGPDDLVHESERTRDMLIESGVPASAITVLNGNVASTRDEAQRIEKEWEAEGKAWKSVTVVTTGFHTARARWIFRRTFNDPSITFHMAAAEHPRFNEDNWYRNEDGQIFYLNELIKTIFYRIKY